MQETLSYARNGMPVLLVDGVPLHSRYDPAAEAERYAASIVSDDRYSIFLLIEPGLGYVAEAVKRMKPRTRVLCAHCSTFHARNLIPDALRVEDDVWTPAGRESFEAFLERNVPDSEASTVKVVDWKPSIAAYGSEVAALVSSASIYLKRAAASARTTEHFGERWLRNGIAAASRIDKALRIEPGDTPILVVAAGPSLDEAATIVAASTNIDDVFILSVASAVPALEERGLRPDLVVASDGGGWASFHLLRSARSSIPLAAALSAALPSFAFSAPVLPIADYSRWQSVLASTIGIETLRLPQRGTVSATALDLALRLTSGTIYLAGFDLGVHLGRTHARPNALDRVLEEHDRRYSPAFSSAYERFLNARNGPSLKIYADWTAGFLARHVSRFVLFGEASPALSACEKNTRIVEEGTAKPRFKNVRAGSIAHGACVEALRRKLSLERESFRSPDAVDCSLFFERSLAGELYGLLFFSESASDRTRFRERGVPKEFSEHVYRRLDSALSDLA